MPELALDHPTRAPDTVSNAPLGTTRELVTLAWPLILSNLAYTAVGFTDTLYMGRLGVLEVGAVGLASLVLFTVSLFFRGTLNAAATFVARALGAGDRAGVRRWGGVFLTLSLIGLPLALVGPWLVRTALNLLGAAPSILDVAQTYAQIRIFEIPFLLIGATSVSIMLGLGNTRTPTFHLYYSYDILFLIICNYLIVCQLQFSDSKFRGNQRIQENRKFYARLTERQTRLWHFDENE